MKGFVGGWALICVLLLHGSAFAQEKSIEERFREMQEKYERRISALEGQVKDLREEAEAKPEHEHSAVDRAIAELRQCRHDQAAPWFHLSPPGGHTLDISMHVLVAAGTSTQREASIQTLQGGGHDPKKRGFTLAQVELSGMGAIDNCFLGEVHLIQFISSEGETEVELEEAFLTTSSLPYGLQFEIGQIFTEFGRINPLHPHQWDFLDQPVINTRLFGPDGMRAPGARLGWRFGRPWWCELHFGAQNANGETMTSFFAEDEAIGGRPFVEQDVRNFGDLAYLARIESGFCLNKCTKVKLGASALFGPNATGTDGSTAIYGADFMVLWRPLNHCRGWPFVIWQSELLYRDYRAEDFFDEGDPLNPFDDIAIPADTLGDWGLYSQLLYGFQHRWTAGVRYEYASGSGVDYDATTGAVVPRADDPFRDDRHRSSAIISYHPSEVSRFRLQYNFDVAEHLDDNTAHTIWFGVEFLLGKHPAHAY